MEKSNQYYRNERKDMLAYLPEHIEKCIEFGCSEGLFSKRVKEIFNAECWGVDLNPDSIKKARVYLDKTITGEGMSVIDDLPDNYFDCLICNDFLEHLPYPDLFLKKIRKSLKPNAVLVASFPNVRSWSTVLEFLIYKDWKYKESGILDKTHLRFFTGKSLRRFLSECDLKIEIIAGTRPSSSRVFLLANLFTLGFISDMRYMGYAVRSVFI
jgi:2-polyprenyl-3-methyl-5-hydroxy-6-metoxy-1,4-benzoquinol methylase